MAEGAPLLREYGRKSIEGSNPSLSAIFPLFSITSNCMMREHFTVPTHRMAQGYTVLRQEIGAF